MFRILLFAFLSDCVDISVSVSKGGAINQRGYIVTGIPRHRSHFGSRYKWKRAEVDFECAPANISTADAIYESIGDMQEITLVTPKGAPHLAVCKARAVLEES